jgi:hypothetical protein
MFKRGVRLPSPAIVISMLALSLVLGGTAVAAGTGGHADAKADTALIKKLAPSLSVKSAKQLNGKPASSYESKSSMMWAVVTNDASAVSIVRSTPGVTATYGSQGIVKVKFPKDVSQCAWIATQGNGASAYVPSAFATVRGDGTSTDVEVITYDDTGAYIDANFHLLVTC